MKEYTYKVDRHGRSSDVHMCLDEVTKCAYRCGHSDALRYQFWQTWCDTQLGSSVVGSDCLEVTF